MIKKTIVFCSVVLISVYGHAATNSTLYTDTFENYTNNEPLIDGTNFWYASSAEAIVQTSICAAGSTKAAMIPIDVTLSNRFAANYNSPNIWLRMKPRIVKYNRSQFPVCDTNATAMFYVDSNGYFVVTHGTNWTTLTETPGGIPINPISESTFYTIDVHLSYTSKTWQIVLSSVVLTNNLGFINTAATNLNGFDVYNAGVSTSYLDDVQIVDVNALPVLSTVPTVLTNAPFYPVNAVDQSFELRSAGDGVLNYYIVTNTEPSWTMIVTTNATGTLTNSATNTVWVKYSTISLLPGIYSNSFDIISTNYLGQTSTLPVIVSVRGMMVSSTNISQSRMIGYAGVSQSLDVIQSGTGDVHYTITTNPAVPWLYLSSGQGTITNDQTNTIWINYRTNGLNVGSTSLLLYVSTPDGGGVTQWVNVRMTNYARPIMSVNFTNYSQTIHKGQQPADTNLSISNLCTTPRPRMFYSATSDVSWLLVNTNNMTTSNEMKSIVVHFGDMTTNRGLYTGHLTVTGTDYGVGYTPTGQIVVSTQVTVRVLIIAPGTPSNLVATKGTYTNAVNLVWNTTTNADHFELWRGTNSSSAYATRFVSSCTATSYVDTGINPGMINYYWVKTINAYGGDGDYSSSDRGWIYLNAPGGVAASDGVYTNKVALSWTASWGAQSYEIWRSTTDLTNTATMVGSTTSTAYDDTSAIVETVYYYWIKSRTYYFGNYSSSETGYRAALLQPAGLVASDGEFTNKVRVIWQPVENAASYEVWRCINNQRSSATQIGTATATGYDDQDVPQGVYYYYWIRAANYEGYSRYSDPDSGWRLLVAPDGISASDGTYPYRIRVSWNASQNASSYEVWRGQGTGIGQGVLTEAMRINDTINPYYDDHHTINASAYYYKVKAKNSLGSSDYSSTDYGWRYIAPATTTRTVGYDYDGDRLADVPMYVSTSGVWNILCSTIGQYDMLYGNTNSVGVAGDYDGDKIADPMVYWPNNGTWIVMLSSIGYSPLIAGSFGGGGASASPADYDGDGVTDLVVYDASSGTLSVLFSNGGAFNSSVSVPLGGSGWAIASADYDGDRKADPAVYSAADGQLIAKLSASGYPTVVVPVGGAGLTFHPADYDGDMLADLVTYEESTGNWIARISSAGYVSIPVTMGGPGYHPVVADYDGDSLIDPAVYNDSTGAWQFKFSASGYATIDDNYGGTNIVPIAR
jgi:hypothetical protein